MELGERKRKILQAIIDDYIDCAEPVGSRKIAKKHELGLSSATIRNEMADLEDMGYLEQPHTSAGRIPSDLGYRLYVDQLMEKYQLTVAEINRIKLAMELKMRELNQVIQEASYAISKLTQYTTIISTPKMGKSTIKYLRIIPIDQFNSLLVLVTDTGVVKNYKIKTYNELDSDFIERLNIILNNKLTGLTLEQINSQRMQEIKKEIVCDEEILTSIFGHISDCINDINSADLYLEGTTNIFNYPEYNDIEKAKEFFSFVEQKDKLIKLLNKVNGSKKINVLIGRENEFSELRECSIVTSTYSIGNKVIGLIGVIGPTRMRYAKTISSLEYLTDNLNRTLLKLFYGDKYD
ncbi:MAG: heat-inducible transcription repressor HrcA [Clostridiaceae bacterium]|nr:heat-inducible transcription repressor HrcA [Clostridiaceae bacterium]